MITLTDGKKKESSGVLKLINFFDFNAAVIFFQYFFVFRSRLGHPISSYLAQANSVSPAFTSKCKISHPPVFIIFSVDDKQGFLQAQNVPNLQAYSYDFTFWAPNQQLYNSPRNSPLPGFDIYQLQDYSGDLLCDNCMSLLRIKLSKWEVKEFKVLEDKFKESEGIKKLLALQEQAAKLKGKTWKE